MKEPEIISGPTALARVYATGCPEDWECQSGLDGWKSYDAWSCWHVNTLAMHSRFRRIPKRDPLDGLVLPHGATVRRETDRVARVYVNGTSVCVVASDIEELEARLIVARALRESEGWDG